MVCRVISKKLFRGIKAGLGATSGSKIVSILGFSNSQNFVNLSPRDSVDLKIVSDYILRNIDVTGMKLTNIQLKVNCACYSGRRHSLKMPVRGQKTRTNASTRKKFNVT